jgi:hypothetical protein
MPEDNFLSNQLILKIEFVSGSEVKFKTLNIFNLGVLKMELINRYLW